MKDRPALEMIDAAEAEGLLRRGSTIVEPTSGNTGVALAMVAAQRGYHCIFTMPDKIAEEKRQLLRAFGAKVVICPDRRPPGTPRLLLLGRQSDHRIDAGCLPTEPVPQSAAIRGPMRRSTGPEIWRQTAGRVTHFVAGVGTGGTISGVGRYLKAQNPAIQVIAADPQGSIYSGEGADRIWSRGSARTSGRPPTTPPRSTGWSPSRTRTPFRTARRVTTEEGILVGGSSGTAVWAALHIGRTLGPDDVVVVLIPDSGRGYLSKLYDDRWMADHGFLRARGETVEAVLASKGDRCRLSCTSTPMRRCGPPSPSSRSSGCPRCRWSKPSRRWPWPKWWDR